MRLISISEHLLALSSSGLLGMGIMNWIGDDENDTAGTGNVSADGGDDLFGDFDDGGGDDFGGMDDGFDGDFDDDFGDMGGGDDFGGMGGGDDVGANMGGGGGQVVQEMENRVDGLENEVAEISSTINTVRSENEEISETVDEVEENVRKLLEIYEMVTRGVNPFVDDVQEAGGMGGSAFGGDFGLFDDEEGEESAGEDVDDDVMDADAESFFDDEALDDFEDEDTFEDEETFEDDLGEVSIEEDEEESDSSSGASSFQELKAEYESGEADWANEDEAGGGGTEVEATIETDEEFEIEAELDEDPIEPESTDEAVVADEDEFEFAETVEEPEPSSRSSGRSDEKPYLDTLPGGYVVDLVVMEWLEFLVGEFGPEEAVRTIEYYERIEWISEPVSEQLLAFLEGLADVEPGAGDELGPVELDIDDHIQSLTFISQLTGDSIDQKIVDHCAQIRGEGRGIQR